MQSLYGNCITEEVTEIPRCCSRRIQSDVACRAALRPLTVPAIWIAPPNSSSFSVRVVLPASGWEMMAKVRLLLISLIVTSFKSTSCLEFVQVSVGRPPYRMGWGRGRENNPAHASQYKCYAAKLTLRSHGAAQWASIVRRFVRLVS